MPKAKALVWNVKWFTFYFSENSVSKIALMGPTKLSSYFYFADDTKEMRRKRTECFGLLGLPRYWKFKWILWENVRKHTFFRTATTFRMATHRIMTLKMTTLSITTLSITTLGIMALRVMTLSILTLRIMTLNIVLPWNIEQCSTKLYNSVQRHSA